MAEEQFTRGWYEHRQDSTPPHSPGSNEARGAWRLARDSPDCAVRHASRAYIRGGFLHISEKARNATTRAAMRMPRGVETNWPRVRRAEPRNAAASLATMRMYSTAAWA